MRIIVQNLAIEYHDEGSGPVMLFLHGWGDGLHTFDLLAPLLSARYRVIRVDLPGFGKSEMPRVVWHLNEYARFVHDFIDKLGIKVDVLIGHSFGGRIIIKGTATKILEVRKIVLIASAGVAERNTFRNAFWRVVAKTGRLATAIPPFTLMRARVRERLYQRLGSDYISAGPLKDTFLNIVHEDLAPVAGEVSVPALLIWGSEDTQTPLREGERLKTLLPRATLEVIREAGHFVHREKPREVAELILKFSS